MLNTVDMTQYTAYNVLIHVLYGVQHSVHVHVHVHVYMYVHMYMYMYMLRGFFSLPAFGLCLTQLPCFA